MRGCGRGQVPSHARPRQGTLTVHDGFFDAFSEQLRPGRHSRVISEVSPSTKDYPVLSLGLSLHTCAMGPPAPSQSRPGVPYNLCRVCGLLWALRMLPGPELAGG
jgi:hypothetical protein